MNLLDTSSVPLITNLEQPQGEASPVRVAPPPRLGFLGVGWIGRNRLDAIAAGGIAEIAAIADPVPESRRAAWEAAPDAELVDSFEALLAQPLDGIVIATPSALHAEQSITALERGFAVFCQKPLGRTAGEAARVVDAARRMNRSLGVDLSYRHAEAFLRLKEMVSAGGIGDVYAVDLAFHNAYGPDKAWFYDPVQAGGGCVIDLGIHLVDLALWVLDFPAVGEVSSRLFSGGRPLGSRECVEDFATARIDVGDGPTIQLACSWNLHAGQDAVISASFHGTDGGVAVRNVDGSFYDFVAERYDGTRRQLLVAPPDAWSGRAAVEWVERLAAGARFDPAIEELIRVAEVLDLIYDR